MPCSHEISVVKIRGAALFSAEGQARRCEPQMSSVWVPTQPFWEEESRFSGSSPKPLQGAAVGQPGQHPAAKFCPFWWSARLGGRGQTCRQFPASPGSSDRAIERRELRFVPCPRAASSPFVYHTSCLLFCLLHTSSPSLIVLPAPHSALWIFGSPWVILITSDIKKNKIK